MATFKFNQAMVAVILIQLVSLLLACPLNKLSKDNEKLQPNNRFNQQLNAVLDHCYWPQKELLDIDHVLNNNYKGLLADDYSEIHDKNYQLTPSLLLVDRCNNRCMDAYEITCNAKEKNVERVFQNEDGEHLILQVNEHTSCQCIVNEEIMNHQTHNP